MEPSPLPFYNIQPRTRDERAAMDRGAIEKARIAARHPREPPPPANVLLPPVNSPPYITECVVAACSLHTPVA
jgi:hypothetical protein